MTLSSSAATVDFNITPTSSGTLSSGIHTLTANTNVPSGYSLSLSSPISPTYTPTTGTISSPLALTSNTWGYALNQVSSSTSNNTIVNGFDPTYATPTPTSTSKWANPQTTTTIKSTTNSTTSLPASAATTVYYGARADMSKQSGLYTSQVQYTATANLTTIPTPTITSITPSQGSTAGGTSLSIVGTGFTVNDQSITTAVTIGGQACTGVTISSNTPTTGQDTIYCNTPVHPTAEPVSVAVTTWRNTATTPANSTSGYTYIVPTVTITHPTNNQVFSAGTTSTTLTVTTDIPAICYYSTYQNPDMTMSTTGGITHFGAVTGLTDNSTHANYVRCQAASGHSYGNEANVTFYIKAATPAHPTTTPAYGATLNTGTTYIYLTSSGATCTWGTMNGSYPYASGQPYTVYAGGQTLYYSCVAGSGNTTSDYTNGSWYFTGVVPYVGLMQTVTTANCPTGLSYGRDARDDATYLVQKMADGRCWMLTNLAYGGGGINTYGDVKTITNREMTDGTKPYYMIHIDSNRTTGIIVPSTSTDGGATNPQYGYLYNWCAAMGAQISTAACSTTSTTPVPDSSISICPSGWRLPTSSSGGEFQQLTDVIGATINGYGGAPGSTVLRSTWLAMYSGYWTNYLGSSGFLNQGSAGHYWSSTQDSSLYGDGLSFYELSIFAFDSAATRKSFGRAVRCIAI